MPPPSLPRGRLTIRSQVIPRIPLISTTSTTSKVTPRITRSQLIATSASAFLSVLMRDPDELITFENALESLESH